jgi:hypothetical protein
MYMYGGYREIAKRSNNEPEAFFLEAPNAGLLDVLAS